MNKMILFVFVATAISFSNTLLGNLQTNIVNDVTLMNPIKVAKVEQPTSVESIQDLIKNTSGPLSIGGGRFSMGGQTASEQTLHLDLRHFDKVLEISTEHKTIRVQSGITWRKIQEAIDPLHLSLKIMQSYANFTVGGSLSVNVHGRYIGQGPLIRSVQAIKVVLADGELVEASPTVQPELFYGFIGGYGGLGVIVEATLELVENTKVKRTFQQMPFIKYRDFFMTKIRSSPEVIFHNADLYPPAYQNIVAISWNKTKDPLTVSDRLHRKTGTTFGDRIKIYGVADLPFGKEIRSTLFDPLILKKKMVVWRNFEASFDVAELEPKSREKSTFVLQEYFVPLARLEDFVPKMAAIFQKHQANIINVSIRHALPDTGSVLAWAREEVFSLVVYYKQEISNEARNTVGRWTRELINAVLEVNGTYYLPYQIHATREQFSRAYPRYTEFFALKAKIDPQYRFRNKLWDTYYTLTPSKPAFDRSILEKRETYSRREEQTFLTLPEWYIVFSYEEYAHFIATHPPSEFPYWRSVEQFWEIYREVYRKTVDQYPFNSDYHVMNAVIGVSLTVEYLLKGLWENTGGLVSEWFINQGAEGLAKTNEDQFIAQMWDRYVQFIRNRPWYEFSFLAEFPKFWSLEAGPYGSSLRRWERRLSFSAELLAKTAWGTLIGWGAASSQLPELDVIEAVTSLPNAAVDTRIKILSPLQDDLSLVQLPRYESFTELVPKMIQNGSKFVEIAGNTKILTTFYGPEGIDPKKLMGVDTLARWPVLTAANKIRVALVLEVPKLHESLPKAEAAGFRVDHIFDY